MTVRRIGPFAIAVALCLAAVAVVFALHTDGALAQQVAVRRAPVAPVDGVQRTLARAGCTEVRSGDYECTTLAGKDAARSFLAAGSIRDYVVHRWSAPGAYMADRSEAVVRTESDLELRVTRGRRGRGSRTGSASFDVRFDVVRRQVPPRSRCDPSCSALRPEVGCRRRTTRKDNVRETLNGPGGGLSAMTVSARLDSPVTGSLGPTDDDYYRAYDACESAGRWGGQARVDLRVRVGALFHIDDWRTSITHNVCTVTNDAETAKPTVDVHIPVAVHCETLRVERR